MGDPVYINYSEVTLSTNYFKFAESISRNKNGDQDNISFYEKWFFNFRKIKEYKKLFFWKFVQLD